ncbi:DUF1642 domain-containing protein [Vagococcus lutrae]|uniref:DUF1642 domain-containing protein n=1 Tax=Vagococcus lutrae TaxID=81947 RepID=UPI00288F8293|nr:DUF1642 domain-containing protein [Vagococcus lutrae]MDT2842636.1 DUF1642 domain-containing protein [Vagococcus lutrae]
MNEDIKIYHVETQEDYDDLMVKLEEQGYKWISGNKPTSEECWDERKRETIIYLNEGGYRAITRGFIRNAKTHYPDINIIKHKAKGVKQMEKVVVPQFVAEWFERNKKGHTIYGLLDLFSDNYFSLDGFREWVENYNLKEENAQEILAKMYLFQNYEVEEEKKYYWRKKKEYMFSFEDDHYIYVNINKKTQQVHFHNKVESEFIRTVLSETEVKQLVSEEDLNKLERIEIDDVQ